MLLAVKLASVGLGTYQTGQEYSMRSLLQAALGVGATLMLTAPAQAQYGGGGGGSGSGEGDWAIRSELQNPRNSQPGSPYGYDRSYSRGPAPWPYPPAYQAVRPPLPWPREPVAAFR